MRYIIICALLAVLIGPRCGLAADSNEASGLADTGANLLAAGKIEKAQTLFYKALAYDSHCAVALYELGKLFETEGNAVSAADFLAHASLELAKDEAAHPDYVNKHRDATQRLQKLNPFAMQYNQLMEDYALELCKISKKSPDSLTSEEICKRIDELSLATILPKDKLPNVDRPKQPSQPANPTTRTTTPTRAPAAGIPPDVERALKAAGWATITGAWAKKGENIYEVTDGKLEASKSNGAIQVFVHKGSTATIKIYVRYKNNRWGGSSGPSIVYASDIVWGEGYGAVINDRNCRIFSPTSVYIGNASYEPWVDHEVTLPAANPMNSVLITVQDTNLVIAINGKPEKRANYPINRDGTFVILITGTATLESPKTMGE